MTAVQLAQPLQSGGVGLDLPGAGVQRAQRGRQQVRSERAHGGDQAVQVGPGPFRHFRLGEVQPGGDSGYLGAELRAVLDRLDNVPGHLVAVSAQRPFGALQREPGLSRHELRKRAGAAPARAQRGHGGGLGEHHPGPAGLAAGDAGLLEGRRPPGAGQRQGTRPSAAWPAAPRSRGSQATRAAVTTVSGGVSASDSASRGPSRGMTTDGRSPASRSHRVTSARSVSLAVSASTMSGAWSGGPPTGSCAARRPSIPAPSVQDHHPRPFRGRGHLALPAGRGRTPSPGRRGPRAERGRAGVSGHRWRTRRGLRAAAPAAGR